MKNKNVINLNQDVVRKSLESIKPYALMVALLAVHPAGKRAQGNMRKAAAVGLALVLALAGTGTTLAAVWTDQADYTPGSVVTISGDNSDGTIYQAGETVHVSVSGPNSYAASCDGIVSESGAWSCQVTLWSDESAVGDYTYIATGQISDMSQRGTFTDSTRNINFATSGLPAGVSITISGSRTNPGNNVAPYTVTFTSPGSSANIGTKDGTEFSYSGFPSSVTVSGITYNLVSTSPASSFITPSGAGMTTVTATYVLACTAPSISIQPSSATKVVGESVTFSVTASGTAPLSYQWRKNGDNIVSATGSSFTISSVVVGDAGDYDVIVSNSCGSVTATSSTATLNVNKAQASVTLGDMTKTYTGNPLTPSATTDPSGLSIEWTNVPQTNAGQYQVTATVNDPNYEGSASGTFTINKADATISVDGYTGVYDGNSHGASGTATGVTGEDLSASLDLGSAFTDVPGGNAHWTFIGGTNYNDASGDVNIEISKADPVIVVTPYSVTYDGNAHTATGTATGVTGESLIGLDLTDTTHTNAGSYTDTWTFTDVTGNYNDDSGTVSDSIAKANPTISVTPYSVTYDGNAHTATGTATGVKGESLSGLDLSGTTHTNAGDYPSDPWTFTDSTGNYNSASGTVHDRITYNWNGFFRPIDNKDSYGNLILNLVKAGSAVPSKFSLSGDQGLGIFAPGYPKSQQIVCDTNAPQDTIEETVTAGSGGLQYDPLTDQYIYVWKTDKSWSNTCRQLQMQLIDGTTHVANFKFTK